MIEPTMSCRDAAKLYAGGGWRVFPCRGKRPLTKHGCKDATTDQGTIDAWWEQWPDANVAIATGKDSGLYVIDVDAKSGGIESWSQMLKDNSIPATTAVKTGGGGYHFYFLTGEALPNTAGKLAKGIDTRGEGGYVIAAPSTHPDTGVCYEFAAVSTEGGPVSGVLSALPDCLIPKERKAEPVTYAPQASHGDQLRRCQDYVASMPAAIAGAGGHNATYQVAMETQRFNLTPAEAWQVMCEYNQRCQPPWSEKELSHKIRQAERNIGADRGKHLANDIPVASGPEPIIHYDKILNQGKAALEDFTDPSLGKPLPKKKQIDATQPWPEHLLKYIPGKLGETVAWMNQVAIKPQPALSLAAALAAWGAVLGRRVEGEYGERTNLYCLGVAATCAGKDAPKEAAQQLLIASGATDLLGGSRVGSDSAMVLSLARKDNPSALYLWDEIGHLISTHSNSKASHEQRILPTLTSLYTSARSKWLGTEYADENRPRIDIDQPNVCLFGSSTPNVFYQAMSGRQIEDGFVGRLLVFPVDDPYVPLELGKVRPAPPTAICETIRGWQTRDDYPVAEGNVASLQHKPFVVPFTPEARKLYAAFVDKMQGKIKDQHKTNGELAPLWGRAGQTASRIALIAACSADFACKSVPAVCVEWACELVEYLTGRLVYAAEQNISDSAFDSQSKQVMRHITAAGSDGIARKYLLRKCRMRSRELSEVLLLLTETGQVVIHEQASKGKGRPVTVFFDSEQVEVL